MTTFTPLTPAEQAQDAKLQRMKLLATSLLVLVALAYVAATALEPRHVFFAYLAATCEAAMVGALADWFAVVALFRRPLGLPLPHTAIIVTNRDRIAGNIGRFIEQKFLSTQAIVARIEESDPAGTLAAWLTKPANAAAVAQYLARALSYALNAFDDRRVRHFLQDALMEQAHRWDVSKGLAEVLDVLTASGRHHALLDHALAGLDEYLAHASTREHLADEISRRIPLLEKISRYLGLALDERAALKLIDIAVAKVAEVRQDPDHELRRRFDEAVAAFIARLREDESLRERVDRLRNEFLENPALAHYVDDVWSGLKAWLVADLASGESVLRHSLQDMAASFGARLAADASIREWINEQILEAAPPFVERHRASAGRFIERQIEAWNEETLVKELERNLGPDLQYIRINGTVVGALAGLAIYSITRFVHG